MAVSRQIGERLVRALQRGGRLAPRGAGWGVWRGRDLRGRCVGTVSHAVFEALHTDGLIAADACGDDRFHWCGPAESTPAVRQPLQLPQPAGKRRTRPASSLEIALRTIEGDGHRALAAAAAKRLEADVERAASGQRVTQNWDFSLAVDGTRTGQPEGRGVAAQRAARRLQVVQDALGETRCSLLQDIVIYGRSMAALARREACSRQEAANLAGRALADLAEAYRLHVPAAR